MSYGMSFEPMLEWDGTKVEVLCYGTKMTWYNIRPEDVDIERHIHDNGKMEWVIKVREER